MMFRYWFGLTFIYFVVNSAFGAMNFSCFDKPTAKELLPDLLKTYKVLIEVANITNNVTEDEHVADIWEYFDATQSISSLHRSDNDGKQRQWIFGDTKAKNFSLVEEFYSCKSIPIQKVADYSPFLFPSLITQIEERPVNSLTNLWEYFKTSDSLTLDKTDTEHDHGLPVDHYIGCSVVTPKNFHVEYDVCLSAINFTMPGGKSVGRVPTRIEIKVYEGKDIHDAKMLENIVYEFSSYRSDITADQKMGKFLPPLGVFCEGMSTTKEFPIKADMYPTLQVEIEYKNHQKSTVDSNKLYYDSVNHVSSFDFTSNYTDEPIAASANLTDGQYRIVHDFNYGLEYVVDRSKDVCERVDKISVEAGDADEDKTTKLMIMKDTLRVLLTHENVDYVYVGTRYLNDLPCDVWVARCNDTNNEGHKIYEVYVLSGNWTIENGYVGKKKLLTQLPVALRVYHGENENRTITTQYFHGYKIYNDANPIAFQYVDILPCLNFVQNYSYLVFSMSYEGTENPESLFKSIGYEPVKNELRKQLAIIAKVSPLRITEFYFQPVNRTIWVFFLLANRSNVAGVKTKWYTNDEIDVSVAHENLNASLTSTGFTFTIVPVKFTVQKGSLNLVPPYFHPSNNTNQPAPIITTKGGGYSSGSMAGLGICMLLIGGVAGLGLAFFLWKRNRGIAYQIYE